MIARIWRGVVKREDGDEYADYIRETGFTAYGETAGNHGAWLLRRDTDERTEFVTFSLWDSFESIRAFAGDEFETAVYYPEDDRYLVERDLKVSHYEVADQISAPEANR
jgi:heme-degrading monooxygenase HmoA